MSLFACEPLEAGRASAEMNVSSDLMSVGDALLSAECFDAESGLLMGH